MPRLYIAVHALTYGGEIERGELDVLAVPCSWFSILPLPTWDKRRGKFSFWFTISGNPVDVGRSPQFLLDELARWTRGYIRTTKCRRPTSRQWLTKQTEWQPIWKAVSRWLDHGHTIMTWLCVIALGQFTTHTVQSLSSNLSQQPTTENGEPETDGRNRWILNFTLANPGEIAPKPTIHLKMMPNPWGWLDVDH